MVTFCGKVSSPASNFFPSNLGFEMKPYNNRITVAENTTILHQHKGREVTRDPRDQKDLRSDQLR